MLKRINLVIVFAIFGLLACVGVAEAGFGISPPYVKTAKPIFPGSHYEQMIMLLRSAADEDLQAEVRINAPEVASWISIDKGEKFDLPRDSLRVPMIVKIDVPANAEIGDYKGYINVRIVPKNANQGSGVAIALGARIDIDLTVTNEEYIDFLVRQVRVPDIEKLKSPWNWKIFSYFFYRTKVVMKIENTGNTKVAPSRVHLDVYDLNEKNLLESYDDKSIGKIEPFVIKETTATFPTSLEVGHYWANVKIYKDKDIVHKDKIAFAVVPSGELPGGTELGIWPWLMAGGIILTIVLIILSLIKIKIWRYLFMVLLFITWPIRFVWKQISILWNNLKIKFWKWIHRKSAKYERIGEEQNDETRERKE